MHKPSIPGVTKESITQEISITFALIDPTLIVIINYKAVSQLNHCPLVQWVTNFSQPDAKLNK
jgi:hypothetical protein